MARRAEVSGTAFLMLSSWGLAWPQWEDGGCPGWTAWALLLGAPYGAGHRRQMGRGAALKFYSLGPVCVAQPLGSFMAWVSTVAAWAASLGSIRAATADKCRASGYKALAVLGDPSWRG